MIIKNRRLFITIISLLVTVILSSVVIPIAIIFSKDSETLPPSVSFLEDSWQTISELSEAGMASTYYKVGDEKTITLSTNEKVVLVILGFNHDDLASGGKAGITLGTKNLLATSMQINNITGNLGGWKDTNFRLTTSQTILSQMPVEFSSVIKQVNKKSTLGGGSTTEPVTSVQTTVDKLFLFSRVETDGTEADGYKDEGKQYAWWQDKIATDRGKAPGGEGTKVSYWTRTATANNSTTFYLWTNGGNLVTNAISTAARGICFGLCI